MTSPHHSTARVGLPHDARARFDALRAYHAPRRLAALLGVSEFTIVQLEDGGKATPAMVAKVLAGLGRVG